MSGKSLDPGASLALQKVEKSARAKQLIRDALMDNDFLKNLSPGQVRNQGCQVSKTNQQRTKLNSDKHGAPRSGQEIQKWRSKL